MASLKRILDLRLVSNHPTLLPLPACRLWAAWAAACLTTSLRGAVLADDTLTSTVTPLSWQQTVVAASAGDPTSDASLGLGLGLGGDAPGDMRFFLPACPTPAVLAFLNAACQELRRAGEEVPGGWEDMPA